MIETPAQCDNLVFYLQLFRLGLRVYLLFYRAAEMD